MSQDQIALVTGASRGIGAAIALELGKQGATVIGTATSANGAEQITQTLQAAGVKGAGMALGRKRRGADRKRVEEHRR